MPAGQILKGVSAFVDGEGRIRHQWIKTKTDSVAPAMIEACLAEFRAYRGRAVIVEPPRRVDRALMNVIPIADPHNGMLSWAPQTGADYDLRIARERLLDKASDVLGRVDRAREALIANLGDWYHANDQRNVTPKSKHQLDVDGRWFKVLQAGVGVFRARRLALLRLPPLRDPVVFDSLWPVFAPAISHEAFSSLGLRDKRGRSRSVVPNVPIPARSATRECRCECAPDRRREIEGRALHDMRSSILTFSASAIFFSVVGVPGFWPDSISDRKP
jgi:hypothetical protein